MAKDPTLFELKVSLPVLRLQPLAPDDSEQGDVAREPLQPSKSTPSPTTVGTTGAWSQ